MVLAVEYSELLRKRLQKQDSTPTVTAESRSVRSEDYGLPELMLNPELKACHTAD
jgi:hypothetical protein